MFFNATRFKSVFQPQRHIRAKKFHNERINARLMKLTELIFRAAVTFPTNWTNQKVMVECLRSMFISRAKSLADTENIKNNCSYGAIDR
jgi:hypothetical protein